MSPSPIRCRGSWKINKRSSEPDRWLDEMGFFRKHTARDPSCLFRVISENVYNTQRYFHKVRLECAKFMASKRHLFEGSLTCPFDKYLKELTNPSESGGLVEISAMSHLYRRDFVIFEANKGPQTQICNGYGDTIYLFHTPDTKHFDVIYTKDFINVSSFCQSIVYEILYDGVYQLRDLSYAVDKMLHEKIPTNHIEYFMSENVERRKKHKERAKIYIEASRDDKDRNNNGIALKCKHHAEDIDRANLLKEPLNVFVFNRSFIQLENICLNCLNVNSAKDLFDNGITPFPYKVAKALDPDIYRNIEFDVWSELRRETRYGPRYSDGTTLQVGVKCLCKLESDQAIPYRCHIQEMKPDRGPCVVFIEELGEKRVVDYEQLESLPSDEIRPWAPPYRYSRTNSQLLTLGQMLQQIGSVTKKQSLGKARSKSKVLEDTMDKVKQTQKFSWSDAIEQTDISEGREQSDPTYHHLDFVHFQPPLVEVQALPLMVDCRGVTGAPPQEHSQSAPNGAPAAETHLSQTGGSGGDAGAHSLSSAASTPPSTSSVVTYSGVAGGVGPPYGAAAGGPCTPYACGGVKAVMWCAPHSPPPAPGPAPAGVPVPVPVQHVPHILPPPLGVNPHVYKSVQPSGADLPMNDIPTLRYYFNLGVECMWTVYGPPFPHAPPHHYSPRDLAQDMQSMSMHDRSGMNQSNAPDQNHKHKPSQGNDKPSINNQGKMNGQRPLLGPRFKRGGGNQDGNMNSNHQNKIHNNMGNKGPNHRRNPHAEGRSYGGGGGGGGGGGSAGSGGGGGGGYGGGGGGEGECMVEQPLISLPYIPYTAGPAPPVYPIQYYPVEADPGMIGMMGGNGMGYLSYEESVEYGAMQQYYGGHHHYPPPPLPPHHHHHHYQPPPPPPPHHGPHHHQQQHHMEPK